MPRIDLLAKLFRAVGDRNLENAQTIASDIAAQEELKGHHTAAQLLRGSLVTKGLNGGFLLKPRPIGPLPNILESALAARTDNALLSEIVLAPAARRLLEEIISESEHAPALAARGIRKRTKLLFHGPPGCGKSLTAAALAKELSLPLYIVRFDSVIGSYLGQTAVHLRELFEFAHRVHCVLLFDEIDALGKRRGHPSDVGELDRIVIALMQELELSDNKGLVIATSNLPGALDPALWRRFDISLAFPGPTPAQLRRFIETQTKKFGVKLDRKLLSRIARCESFADAARQVEDTARRQVLLRP